MGCRSRAAPPRLNRESPGGRLRRCAAFRFTKGQQRGLPCAESKPLAAQHVFRSRSQFRFASPAAARRYAGPPRSTATAWGHPPKPASPASRANATARATTQTAGTHRRAPRASDPAGQRTAEPSRPYFGRDARRSPKEEVVVMSMMSDSDLGAVAGEPAVGPPSPAAAVDDPNAVYALGSRSGESTRLQRQAEELAPDSAALLDSVVLRPGESAIDVGRAGSSICSSSGWRRVGVRSRQSDCPSGSAGTQSGSL